jgi:hypothetical protein
MRALLSPRFREVSLDFITMIGGWIREARRAREEGRKVILVPFNFPPEIIYLFRNAVPLTSEVLTTLGVSVLEGQGERYWDYAMGLGIPDFLCSSSTIGWDPSSPAGTSSRTSSSSPPPAPATPTPRSTSSSPCTWAYRR